MAYDQEVAHRIRELLADRPGITERAMFGGLAFLVNGNMSVTVSGGGGLLVRSDPRDAALLDDPDVALMVMRGREMPGWLRIGADVIEDDTALTRWTYVGADYARTRAAVAIVKGLRAVADFEYESQMALMNRRLAGDVETVFLMPAERFAYTSSRLIKEVVRLGGDVHGLVPALVEERLHQKFAMLRDPASAPRQV